MSLLRLVKIEVTYRPGIGRIGDIYFVFKLVGGRATNLEREAATSGSM